MESDNQSSAGFGAGYVGRGALRELLAAALGELRAGRGGLLLVEGEPGMGKTRTLDLLCELATSAGTRCLRGRCSEVPGAPPLLPFRQLLGGLGDGTHDFDPSSGEAEDEAARFHYFQAIALRVLAEADGAPLLVTVDDLHAADLATIQLLEFLAREAEEHRVLVAGALRHTDVPADTPLRAVLDRLGRRARTVRLEGLDSDDVARLVSAVGHSSVHGEVGRAVFERSLGNPLFATQLALLLVASGLDLGDPTTAAYARERVPSGVLAVLRGRMARVPEAAVATFTLAATFGREFDLDLLEAAASELEPAASGVATSLEAGAAARVVEPVPGVTGRWRFAHVLFRDVLYEDATPARRRACHRAACRAIAGRRDLGEDVWLMACAHHALEAVAPETAGEARVLAERAGRRAMARFAQASAVGWFEGALRALELDPDAEGLGAERLGLRVALATALWRSGATREARDEYARALELARSVGDSAAFAEAAIGLAGRTDVVLGPEPEAAAVLEEAAARLANEPSRLRVDVLTRLASARYFDADGARREAASLEAIACAEALGDPSALGYALTARFYLLSRPGRLAERAAIVKRTLPVVEGRPEESATAIARYQAVLNGMERGAFTFADRQLAIHGELAERLGEPFLRWQHAALCATRALAAGELDRGEDLAFRARAMGEEFDIANALAWFAGQLYGLRRAQGRLAELEPVLADMTTRFPEVPGYAFARAEALLAGEREPEARAFLEAAGAAGFRDLSADFNWPSVVAIAARCIAWIESPGLAEALYRAMEPAAGSCVLMPFGSLWDGAMALPLGRLATVVGWTSEASSHLAEAAELHARIGARAHLAETWLAQAELASREGARAEASRRAGEASALFRELGMPTAAKRADALARPGAPAAGARAATHRFGRSGEGWRIRFGEREAHLPDARGMAYLAALLERPGEHIHVLDLAARAGADNADAGAVLDARARREVRARMHELAGQLEDAEERNDAGRVQGLREELERLEEELVRALGLGGRARRVGDPVERARKAVYNRIRDAVARVEAEIPELGRHLKNSVRTGRSCVYQPESRAEWIVDR